MSIKIAGLRIQPATTGRVYDAGPHPAGLACRVSLDLGDRRQRCAGKPLENGFCWWHLREAGKLDREETCKEQGKHDWNGAGICSRCGMRIDD